MDFKTYCPSYLLHLPENFLTCAELLIRTDVTVLTRQRGLHSLAALAAVAEPDAHHLLVQLQRVGHAGDLARRRLGLLLKARLQGDLDLAADGRSPLATLVGV